MTATVTPAKAGKPGKAAKAAKQSPRGSAPEGPARGDLEIPSRPVPVQKIAGGVVLLAMLVFGAYSLSRMGFDFGYLTSAAKSVRAFFGTTNNTLSFPSVPNLIYLAGLTIGVVVLGTIIAALISIPVAYIAAANTTPSPWLHWLGRAIGVLTRAVPDVVIAFSVSLMFALGSTLPGVIAIGIHSIGMISKLFADAIEQIDEGPRLAIRAAGGSKAQEFWAGVFPQVVPSWVATTLHRFDINIRGSAILGYAGVGGLGYAMSLAFNQFNYGRGLGIALVIFVMCIVLEIISSTVRRNLLGIQPTGKGIGERIVRAATRNRPVPQASPSRPTGAQSSAASIEAAMRRPWTRERVRDTAWVVAALVFVGLSYWWSQVNPGQIMWKYVLPGITSFWPPSFGQAGATAYLNSVVVTLELAFAAALVAIVFSLVIGSFAARNVAPNGVVRNIFRVILTLLRGIPELIVALFLIVIVGLGPVPGFIALTIGGVGLLGKLIADSFEEVPNGPETALSAAGATRSQRYVSATLPQGLPSLIGNSLYLVDTNIRSAVLLGVVGAGGIGYYLTIASPQLNQHGEVTVLVAFLIVVVLVIEGIAAWLRSVFK
ncbi:PhnE/PtxC family ABC transporter permease [Gryllotalpicola reticulitermitis]|uniref:PhnE/PtxC family ABC transporter permease n=1 Tax=Gryllotalpicola reticulitermitis TaxID=1184153 RepID=A0ABV8Q6X1_9MICO